jgi:hypothetical protein
MAKRKAPYFIIPYDSIRSLQLTHGTQFYRQFTKPEHAFDKDPFNDNINLKIMLGLTLDTWCSVWKHSAIKDAYDILKANMPQNPSDAYLDFMDGLKSLIDKVEHIRTMHVMKLWDLDKLGPHQGDEPGVDFDKLLQDLETIKAFYHRSNE